MLSTTIVSLMELERLRAEIAALLEERGIGGHAATDTGLIVTELAVNGFEHGDAGRIELRIVVDERDILVELTHVGVTDLAIPACSAMPDPLSLRHRGLAIIDSLARGRETFETPKGTIVRCAIAR